MTSVELEKATEYLARYFRQGGNKKGPKFIDVLEDTGLSAEELKEILKHDSRFKFVWYNKCLPFHVYIEFREKNEA